MQDNIPDALDLFEEYEVEQERMRRIRRQREIEWEMSDWGMEEDE